MACLDLTKMSEEQFSLVLNEALDILGYNKEMVAVRQRAFDNKSKQLTDRVRAQFGNIVYETVSGSKREGLSSLFEGDVDFMVTFTHIRCTDDPTSVADDVSYIFELDRANVPEGYTKLRLAYRNPRKVDVTVENSLIPGSDGLMFLSSDVFLTEISIPSSKSICNKFRQYHRSRRSGPSRPLVCHDPILDTQFATDHVISFPCKCTNYLQSWINRPRDFDWPSKDQIEAVATLDAHVVPVGVKGTEEEHLQWRICFTLAEVNLMQSLIETQWKLYVLLKMIKDVVFKSLGDVLTSYVLKNAAMWIFEADPVEQMQPRYIIRKLSQCFDYLMLCFCSKNMSSFMIRDRNLLEGKLNEVCRKEHMKAVNEMRRNCTALLLRCPKLKETMMQLQTSPEKVRNEMMHRNQSEMLGFCYSLLHGDQADVLQRAASSRSATDYFNVVLQFIADNPEVAATALGVPADTIFNLIQRLKLASPSQLTHLVRWQAKKLYQETK